MDCWYFAGYITRDGYGKVGDENAHRVVYQNIHGNIPAGLVVDHLCRVRCCVNPAHLQLTTNRENLRLGKTRNTHCKQGHEWAENTYIRTDGNRRCKACNVITRRNNRHKTKV